MEIVTANFTKDTSGKKTLKLLFKDEDNVQRWASVSEGSERFSSARELFSEYNKAESPEEESRIATEIIELIDTKARVRKALKSPTNGIFTTKDASVYYNGEKLNEHLSAHITRMFKSDSSPRDEKIWSSFAKFVENLQQNTDPFVRDQLYSWLASMQAAHGGFTITDDGYFLAYKGCPVIKDGVHYSGWSGNSSVLKNGEVTDYVNSQIPNEVGTTVFMKRSDVTADPAQGCGPGLHFSTLNFAQGHSRDGNVFLLKIHPANVVSIPTDCDAQKGRTDKYEIIDVLNAPLKSGIYSTKSEDSVKDSTKDSESVSTSVDNDTKTTESSDSMTSKANSGSTVYNMTNYQRGEIFAGLEFIGIYNWEKSRALKWLSDFLGREVDSRKNLTYSEADRIIAHLNEQ